MPRKEDLKMLRTDTEKIKNLDEKKFLEEKLGNRIMLNVVYTIVAYLLLFICYNFSTGFNGMNPLVMRPAMYGLIVVFVLFAVIATAFYVWSYKTADGHKKNLIRNHAHMLLGFCAGAFIINLPKYLQIIPLESTSGFLRTILQCFKNTMFNYKLVAILIAVTFVVLCVFNFIQYRELSKVTKKSVKNK